MFLFIVGAQCMSKQLYTASTLIFYLFFPLIFYVICSSGCMLMWCGCEYDRCVCLFYYFSRSTNSLSFSNADDGIVWLRMFVGRISIFFGRVIRIINSWITHTLGLQVAFIYEDNCLSLWFRNVKPAASNRYGIIYIERDQLQ